MAELDKTISVIESWLKQPVLTPPPINELYDALELLKEQEPVKPNGMRKSKSVAFNGMLTGYCPRCGTIVNSVGNSESCGKCGQKLDWE